MISLELDPNKARHDLTKEETVEDLIPSGKMPDVFEDTTRQTWASLRHLGGGPEYYKIAGRIYYSRTAVEKWLEQNRFIRTDRPVNATQADVSAAEPAGAAPARD